MCRVLAYLGEPISLEHVLFETDSSLVRQSYSPRMMAAFLNLAGFGMVAWDRRSVRAEDPFTYRVTTLPAFDRNLRSSGREARARPACVAHVRGITYSEREMVAEANLHPFRFRGASVALAHNGHLREFARMRYDLVRAHPARARAADRGDDGLRVDLRARALAARGSRTACRSRASSPTPTVGRAARPARGPRAARDRHLVAGEPVPHHRPGARRHAVLVRLRLVPGRGRAARDGPAVREPLVHARRRVRRCATASRR